MYEYANTALSTYTGLKACIVQYINKGIINFKIKLKLQCFKHYFNHSTQGRRQVFISGGAKRKCGGAVLKNLN